MRTVTLPGTVTLLACLLALAACRVEEMQIAAPGAPSPSDATAFASDEPDPDSTALAAQRSARDWRRALYADSMQVDTLAASQAQAAFRERADAIRPEAFRAGFRPTLPIGGDVAGPSVLAVQILLDRAGFSPGPLDGAWGSNAEKAAFWFQRNEDLPATGVVDAATFERLVERAGRPAAYTTTYRLTEDDLDREFKALPSDVYERAKLRELGYESIAEMLGERFHAAPALLRQLNPGRDLNALKAGDEVTVPATGDRPERRVERLVVSGQGRYLHALGPDGRIAYHFPATLGAGYDPSPEGELEITSVTERPWWHYQPRILARVPDDRPEARLPPGPNNDVGLVWMALSEPHYGIHGTKSPETIGYAASAGCVRLTNWDALALAARVGEGTPVRFRDIEGRSGSGQGETAARPENRREDRREDRSRGS
ncbi:MAG: L,D-transpeptidase family protein [Rubricoccaceae bacterium]